MLELWALQQFFLSGQLDVLIKVYCDLIGYIKENGQLNNMTAGPKIWRKSPDPTQQSGWGLGNETIPYEAITSNGFIFCQYFDLVEISELI